MDYRRAIIGDSKIVKLSREKFLFLFGAINSSEERRRKGQKKKDRASIREMSCELEGYWRDRRVLERKWKTRERRRNAIERKNSEKRGGKRKDIIV